MAAVQMRARPVDNSKPLPILLAEDVPDIHEATSVQRSLPQMATGMEKEEEEV
jgi:enhancer of polycomb-like protein